MVVRFVNPRLAITILSTMLIIMGFFQVENYYKSVINYRRIEGAVDVIEYIIQNTAADDYVLMWGAESKVNFYAKRPSPTKYVYQYPLHKKNYAGAERLEDFFSDIIEKKPKLIIITTGVGKIPRSFSGGRSEKTDMMANTIRSMYRKKVWIGDWVVFEHTEMTQE